MDGESGTQIAPPIVMQPPPLPSIFRRGSAAPKKRDLAWQNTNPNGSSVGNWNPKLFSWDSVNFSVNQRQSSSDDDDGGENLSLKLGGGGEPVIEEDRTVVRPSKKVRPASPGSTGGGNYPMCQVDDCKTDLSNAKDYHRRHKVCEVHSKMTKAIVGKQMQRFCQQCSRFHLLSEFDEGKRSCRRRLAGHNRRRRKVQPEDASSRLLSTENLGSNGNNNLDIVKLLAILSRLQGDDKVGGNPTLPVRDQVNHIISKIHSLQTANSASKSSVSGGLDLNISQVSEQPTFEHPTKTNENTSTMDLLAILSSALGSSSPDALATLSQVSIGSSGDSKTKITCGETVINNTLSNQSTSIFSTVGPARNKHTLWTQMEICKDPVEKAQPSLPLQLFGSAENDSPPNMGSTRKYLSSESSNPIDDRSPSSSPPVAQKLFPLHSVEGSVNNERMSNCQDFTAVRMCRSHGWITPLDLFKESDRRVDSGAMQSLPCQAGYTSSSGSDNSPSSSNSDGQERTGRISFKLFDKDPSSFPGALRDQILSWLSNSPSEMESYIRPGCVVLSIYASMASGAWDDLERNLLQRVTVLVQSSHSGFWRTGRFLVRTNRQLASFKDGKVHLCKSWKSWSAPELTFVSPIAVVRGQETSFILKGRNLTAPGTRIHCTCNGGYTSKEVMSSAYPGTIYDGSSVESFSFHGGSLNDFGRCFIEVENGFKGNSFPVIIADATVCRELRVLESDFERDITTEVGAEDPAGFSSKKDVLHFLNELGWLFQRKSTPLNPITGFSSKRFNFLITFSVERDWPAVVKKILDMLVERSLTGDDSLAQESLQMLLEIQPLSRAVKRKCRKMVDLLLHYSVKGRTDGSKMYLFPPNSVGPGGMTPLHLAASMQDSEDMVNALTDDPQQIGLYCWNSIFDESGQSPYMYASMRNHSTYNELVARKLADKKNNQVSVVVGNQDVVSSRRLAVRSCAQCARLDVHRSKPMLRHRGILHRPYIHSMLAIAAVCVCVCLLMRGMPKLDNIAPFMWEKLDYGPR